MAKSLRIVPDRVAWTAGEKVTGHLEFELRRPTKVKAVGAQLRISEFAQAVDMGQSNTDSSTVSEEKMLVEAPLELTADGGMPFAPGEFPAGSHRWRFSALLPAGLLSTFEARKREACVALRAYVSAHVEVPWAVDPKVRAPLLVVAAPLTPGRGAFGGQRVARGEAPPGAFALSLSATEVMRGGVVTGTLSYDDEGAPPPGGLTVRLVEEAIGRPKRAYASVERVLGEVGTGSTPTSREPVPFAIPVPKETAPSLEGQIISLHHLIEVEAEMGKRKNPKMGLMIRIV